MPKAKASFIIACYNYGRFLPETIDSVLAQTYSDFEVIIVDDASNDGTTPAIVKQQAMRDKRIRAIFHSENKGAGGARNTAIKAVETEYITGLDADDLLDPTYLEKTMAKMESTDADAVYTHLRFFGKMNEEHHFPANQNVIKKYLLYSQKFPMWALHRKSDCEEFGGYDETLESLEDWDFWLNFVSADKNLVLVDEALYFYRKHGRSRSDEALVIKRELFSRIRKNHPKLYKRFNWYFSIGYLKHVVRPNIFQLRTRKGRRLFRLFSITLYEEK